LPAKAGTDAALAMAMTHVIFKEFYIDRQVEYFTDYAKTYTDLPFVVVLEPHGNTYASGRFLRASDLGIETKNAQWKTILYDAVAQAFCVPNGSIGFRWSEEGRWNLKLEDAARELIRCSASRCKPMPGRLFRFQFLNRPVRHQKPASHRSKKFRPLQVSFTSPPFSI
jgi:nitrate reductase alpha subunit